MKITFLGTGTSQGIPLIACKCDVCTSSNPKDKRLRVSVLIETEGRTFVIDTGPDFRQQMLRENVSKLDAVIFTHEHMDHISGLDDVKAFNFIFKKHVDIYATNHVQGALKRVYKYIFEGLNYPGIPKINLHTIDNNTFTIKGVKFTPIEVMHYRLPVLGYRIDDFTYITDASYISAKEKEKIKGSKVVVLNALRREKHISHFTLDEAVELLTELNPEKAYLIHISHQLGLHDNISKELPGFIELAHDGLQISMK